MLNITNGDHANTHLQQSGIEGTFLSWADVLHDGPVPAGLTLSELSLIRARFISYCGWASEFEAQTHFQTRDALFEASAANGEIVIWNSHELYDQLHLLQILNWYHEQGQGCKLPKVVFVSSLLGTGELDSESLKNQLANAEAITTQQCATASSIWQAFTSNNPRGLAEYSKSSIDGLPFMKAALQRLIQEYPGVEGVSRTEHQILRAIELGNCSPGELFSYSQQQEEITFMGDSTFWLFLKAMINSDLPLVSITGSKEKTLKLPGMFGPDDQFMAQKFELTEAGMAVLAGDINWLLEHNIDRWIGGVHLNPENRWIWNGADFLRQ